MLGSSRVGSKGLTASRASGWPARATASQPPGPCSQSATSRLRVSASATVASVAELYRSWKAIEDSPANRKDGLGASYEHVSDMLKQKGVSYDQFVLSL